MYAGIKYTESSNAIDASSSETLAIHDVVDEALLYIPHISVYCTAALLLSFIAASDYDEHGSRACTGNIDSIIVA
jgi:hypothetical protein